MKIDKNQKIFVSFAYTGQDKQLVGTRMEKVCQVLSRAGLDFYCNLYDKNCEEFTTPGEFVSAAIAELKKYDVLLAIVASEHRSQGQLMEIGAALALGKPVYTLMYTGAKGTGYIEDPNISAETSFWSSEPELYELLAKLPSK